MMERVSSRLLKHRSWIGAAHSIANEGICYRVVLLPQCGLSRYDREDRKRWYKSFLEACKIDPDKIKTTYRDHEFVLKGYLLKDQAKRIPTMGGFYSMKRIETMGGFSSMKRIDRDNNTLAKGGDVKVYKVNLYPCMSMNPNRHEENERWFNALLMVCNIDPSTVIRHPNDNGMWFQAALDESQLKQLRKLSGCKSAKEIPESAH